MLGLFVSRRSFFVLFPGLFVSWTLCLPKEAFCPISGIICLPKEVFCPIAGIICFPKEVFLSHCWDYLSPEGGFLSHSKYYFSRKRFSGLLLGLFVPMEVFCPIARIICLSKVVCLSHFLDFLSPERAFLSHCWDYFSPEGSFFVPLLGLFVFPTAGVVVSKRRYFAHCWDCLSPEGGFLSQCRDFLFPKEGILPTAFYLPKEICFSKRTII